MSPFSELFSVGMILGTTKTLPYLIQRTSTGGGVLSSQKPKLCDMAVIGALKYGDLYQKVAEHLSYMIEW